MSQAWEQGHTKQGPLTHVQPSRSARHNNTTRRYLHHTGIQPTPVDIDRLDVEEGACTLSSHVKKTTWGQQVSFLTRKSHALCAMNGPMHWLAENPAELEHSTKQPFDTQLLRQRLSQDLLVSLQRQARPDATAD
jgi:hypothetical protein